MTVDNEPSSEADRIIDLYERNAANWNNDRGRDLFEKPWLDRFLDLAGPAASILDIGCGAAEPIASYFIGRGHAVTGIDSSPSLVGICQGKFPDQTWITADMRALDLGVRFDALIAWHSLIHLKPVDHRLMFAIFRRHAKPGAVLMFTSAPGHGEVIGSYRGEPLYHGSLAAEDYRKLLTANDFTVVSHVVQDPNCGHATVWLAKFEG